MGLGTRLRLQPDLVAEGHAHRSYLNIDDVRYMGCREVKFYGGFAVYTMCWFSKRQRASITSPDGESGRPQHCACARRFCASHCTSVANPQTAPLYTDFQVGCPSTNTTEQCMRLKLHGRIWGGGGGSGGPQMVRVTAALLKYLAMQMH